MADKSVSLLASDLFSLGGSFVAQSSTKNNTAEYASMLAANGDFVKWSEMLNHLYSITVTYKWSGVPAAGALGAAITAAITGVGSVRNGYLITELSVATNYKDWPTITLTGHQHLENAHEDDRPQYAIPTDISTILTGQFGAYDFLQALEAGGPASADDMCVTDSTYTLSVTHIDADCTAGEHWVGTNTQGKENVNENLIGRVTLPAHFHAQDAPIWLPDTANAWYPTSASNDDSNTDFNKSNITADRYVARIP